MKDLDIFIFGISAKVASRSWAIVELSLHSFDLLHRHFIKLCSFRKILANESVGVLVGTKKHKLILAKKDLEEKISAFGRKSNNRFELAIAFLKEANQAEKYAQQESRPSQEAGRDFLKKIGSNFRIAERTLSFPLKNAWILAGKYHADPANAGEAPINFSESTNWRCT